MTVDNRQPSNRMPSGYIVGAKVWNDVEILVFWWQCHALVNLTRSTQLSKSLNVISDRLTHTKSYILTTKPHHHKMLSHIFNQSGINHQLNKIRKVLSFWLIQHIYKASHYTVGQIRFVYSLKLLSELMLIVTKGIKQIKGLILIGLDVKNGN